MCASHVTPATRRSIDSSSPKQSPRHLASTFNRRETEHGGQTRWRLWDWCGSLETYGDWAASKYAGHDPWARAPYGVTWIPFPIDRNPTVTARDNESAMGDIKHYNGNGIMEWIMGQTLTRCYARRGRCACCVLVHKCIRNKIEHISLD